MKQMPAPWRAEDAWRTELSYQGWTVLQTGGQSLDTLTDLVLRTALALGRPMPGRRGEVVETLSPMIPEEAPASSLSASFGLGAFPFHNDNAHLPIPSRFIVLACAADGGGAPTYFVDGLKILKPRDKALAAKSAVFHVKSGGKSFYATILDRKERYVRFDPGCMTPQGADGERLMNCLGFETLQSKAVRWDWRVGDILVLDNWRMLHARGEVTSRALGRTMIRCNVG